MLSAHYRAFFESAGGALHVTAHSHHPWPDVSRAAQIDYWEDSARLTNRKWDKVFGEVVPQAQRHIAKLLGLPHPQLIAFAPNTHELVVRLYSCLDWSKPIHVLTTSNEFHSFGRQTRRLEETGRVQVTRVQAEPYTTFNERFHHALNRSYDLVFLSHVFFDSGFVVEGLEGLLSRASPDALVVVDGYHAFCALPVDLSRLAHRIFYMAGGYKYAQSGEGVCFMSIPEGCELRPISTGWFSDFGKLSGQQGEAIGYGAEAMRFWGSTFDASGLYRFNAVMQWLHGLGVTPKEIHEHVQKLQTRFLDGLADMKLASLPIEALTPPRDVARGNFCTFDLDNAEAVEQKLLAHDILVDRRARRVRFGFGVYHDEAFVDTLLARLRTALV